MKTLHAELVPGETRHGGIDVFEVWHDSSRKRTIRWPLGRAYTSVQAARRCAVRRGLIKIDEQKLTG